jgi:hypothetical protein
MKKGVRCELVELHTVNKKKPTEKLVAGRERPRRRKARNITR